MTKRKRRTYPKINGVPASKTQIRIGKALGGEINYKPEGLRFYIDIALLDETCHYGLCDVAVEIDSWMYHKNKKSKDRLRAKVLENNGWKVLSVKYAKNLPSLKKIEDAIEDLKNSDDTYHELKTNCWLHAENVRRIK